MADKTKKGSIMLAINCGCKFFFFPSVDRRCHREQRKERKNLIRKEHLHAGGETWTLDLLIRCKNPDQLN